MITRRTALSLPLLAMSGPRFVVAQDQTVELLMAEPAQMQILGEGSPKSDVLRFQKEFPVAILRAKQGEVFRCHLLNKMPDDLWLHWHGVRGPNEVMTTNIAGGELTPKLIEFTPPDAGTFWFGPLLNASKLRDSGLYGILIVEEKKLDADFYDQPLVLDDWMVGEDGKLDSDFGNMERAIGNGRMGNWFTVNGLLKPKINIPRAQITRMRLLNAANTRTFNVNFKGADTYIIARDGQPVPFAQTGLESTSLAPGQRADLLLVNAQDVVTMNFDLFEDVVEAAVFETGLDVSRSDVPDNFSLPANPVSAVPEGEPLKFTLVFEGGAKGGLKQAKVGQELLPLRALIERKLAWAINGIAGLGGDLLFEVPQGSKLHITLQNKTAFGQSISIQGHVWRVLSETGPAPFGDTTVVPPMADQVLELVADNVGSWAIYSTVAERADAGLIGGFKVAELP